MPSIQPMDVYDMSAWHLHLKVEDMAFFSLHHWKDTWTCGLRPNDYSSNPRWQDSKTSLRNSRSHDGLKFSFIRRVPLLLHDLADSTPTENHLRTLPRCTPRSSG
jgi:hypothetical protein